LGAENTDTLGTRAVDTITIPQSTYCMQTQTQKKMNDQERAGLR